MAQKQLDVKKANKGPVGVSLVRTPYSGKEHLVICSATGLPMQHGYALDRAFNSMVVESPYIGALLLFNLRALSVASKQVDRQLSDQLVPRIDDRLLSTMWQRLTRNQQDRIVYADMRVAEQAVLIKGRRGAHTKFLDALNASLKDAPLVYSDKGDAPMLPVAYSISRGFSWAEILPLLTDLKMRAAEFERQWGWHGRDLRKTAQEIHEKRKNRREKPTYLVVMLSQGKFIVNEEFTDLVAAHERAAGIMSKAVQGNNPWICEVLGNNKKFTDKSGGELDLAQEVRWRQGQCMLSIYRDPKKLSALLEPSSSLSVSDD